MSHLALKPESFATDSNLLKGSLRYMQGAALRPSLTLARHLGLLVHSTRVNQLQLIPPTSYGGVLRHLSPEPNRPSPLYRGGVPVGGRGVNLPILFGHQFSHTIGSPHSRVNLFLFSSYIIPKPASNVKAIMATTKELFLLLLPSPLVRDVLL